MKTFLFALAVVACGGEPFAGVVPSLGGSASSSAGGPSLGGSAGAGAGAGGQPSTQLIAGAGGDPEPSSSAGAGGELGGAPPASSSGPCSTSGWRATAFATWEAEAPALAVDGDPLTRWQSGAAQAPGQWFALELDQVLELEQLELASAIPEDLPAAVDLVLDGKPVTSTSSRAGGVLRVSFAPTTARVVRLELVSSSSTWWSIYEVGGLCR